MNKFKECNQCPYEFHDKNWEPCKDCVPKKNTNADRIRSMSDEELAEYLPIVFDMMCNPTDKCREITCNHGECTRTMECALKWLQSEAE